MVQKIVDFLESLPRPLLLFILGFAAISYFVLIDPPYTKCNSQLEIFNKNMTGELFAKQGKVMMMSPRSQKYAEACRVGNSAGACFQLLGLGRLLLREINSFDATCSENLAAVEEIKSALGMIIGMMTKIAWGESPPTGPESRYRWFEAPDVNLYCNLRETYLRLYGEEELQGLRNSVFAGLPGQAPEFADGKCVNCEFRKAAPAVMSSEEIWKRSMFSAACSAYR
jgi:hypothetical protein